MSVAGLGSYTTRQSSQVWIRTLLTVCWLRQVWGGAADAAAGAETGAVARMHSALIAVVAHLLARLGGQALDEAQVCLCASSFVALARTTRLHIRCRLEDKWM